MPGRKIRDLTGQRFGKLVAVAPTGERSRGYVVWECLCDCGNTVLVRSGELQSGDKTSCGCKKKASMEGMRFGRLTVLRETEKRRGGAIVWECLCDCGNTTFTIRSNLVSGSVQSCGCLHSERMKEVGESNAKDLTGQRFGKLVAIRPTERRLQTFVVWECLCDCGKTHHAASGHLMQGAVQSCGCLRAERVRESANKRAKDLTGQRFGKLVAVRPTERRENRFVVWECVCDCGNICFVSSGKLIYGYTKSCGCLRTAILEERCKQTAKDLTGQRFGRLVAVRPTEQRENRFVVWECVCDCGNICFVSSGKLVHGMTKSCGCLKKKNR